MKKFVFVTHFTPTLKLSLLRKKLQELYLKALHAQTYSGWKVLIIGEAEFEDTRFKIVHLNSNQSKENIIADTIKIYEREDVMKWVTNSDYLIKLDDDDIISPNILEKIKSKNFDVCYDEFHTFYNITSGQITQQKRPWIASTCVHKTTHALSPINGTKKNFYSNSVLYTEHSQVWHQYYAGKNNLIADPSEPVYLRVLSPTSITAGAKRFPIITTDDIDFNHYHDYLHLFGNWENKKNCIEFDAYLLDLKKSWEEFSGQELKKIPMKNLFKKFQDKLKHFVLKK